MNLAIVEYPTHDDERYVWAVLEDGEVLYTYMSFATAVRKVTQLYSEYYYVLAKYGPGNS